MSGDAPMTVLHLQGGHVLAVIITSGSSAPDVDALTGGSHLAVAAKFDPFVTVDVPAEELTAVKLPAPLAVLDRPGAYVLEDVGGPRLGLATGSAPTLDFSTAGQLSIKNGPPSAHFIVVLMTAAGAAVARDTLNANPGTATIVPSPGGAITAALVAPEGGPYTLDAP